jgi:hypothetical protein
MRLLVHQEHKFKVAGQQRLHAMIHAHRIAPLQSELNRMHVRRHIHPQNRMILRDYRLL